MKFCFFSTQYLPTVGGVERYTFNTARLLTERGHDVTVVTSSLKGLPQQETDSYGIKVVRVPSYPLMKSRFPFVKVTKLLPAMKEVFADGMDFCVIQTRFYPLSVAAAFVCHRYNVPAVVIDHSTGHMPMGGGIVGKVAELYEHIACRLIKKRTAGFYGVSAAVSRWLSHFGVESAGQLYNAVNLEAIQAELAEDPVDFRSKLNLNPDCHIVSFAGRLIEEKGVKVLIEAFEKCGFENAALLIAGNGPLYEELAESEKENVYLLGSLPHNHTLQLMAQSSVYCLPTMYAEGFPTTFLEAAARHCPVITTVTGGTEEFMPDESYGMQIKDLSADSLARCLKKAVEDESWRTAAAEKAFRNLEQNFVWEKTCDRLEQIALKNK